MPFRVNVHDPLSVADLIDTGVDVKAGYISTFLINPSQTITSNNTKHLSQEKRQCQFKNENRNLELFKDFSEANCIFECQLKTVFGKCGCTPWDYPVLNDSMPTCDSFGRLCFKKFMVHPNTTKTCNYCAHDCTTTRYSFSVYSTRIDADVLCSNDQFRKALQYGTHLSKNQPYGYFAMPPMFIRRYEQIVQEKDIGHMNMCLERVKNLAIVNFQIESPFFTRIKRTQRVSFADTLSNIGRYLSTYYKYFLKIKKITYSSFRWNIGAFLWHKPFKLGRTFVLDLSFDWQIFQIFSFGGSPEYSEISLA